METEIKFKELYDLLLSKGYVPEKNSNKEMFHLDILGVDIEIENYTQEKGKFWTKIKKVYRHKVSSKEKWLLSVKNIDLFVTGDHSLVAIRHGELKEFKPKDLVLGDLIVNKSLDSIILTPFIKCEKVGYFSNEWVYDIEVEDYSHTFFANNLLIHNSNYLSFGEVLESCGMGNKSEKEKKEFLLKLDSEFLTPFYNQKFQEFCDERNLENLLVFETETIARKMVIMAKNKNFQNVLWVEGVDSPEDSVVLKYTGGHIKSATTPRFAREYLKDLFKMISDHREPVSEAKIIKKLKEIKKEISMVSIDKIAETGKMSKYDEYVVEDKNSLIVKKGAPYRVSAAAKYNFALNKQPTLIRNRYKPIKEGKIKVYSTAKGEYFAYNIGEFPIEFAPKPDRDGLFEKFILSPINEILTKCMEIPALSKSLVYTKPLF